MKWIDGCLIGNPCGIGTCSPTSSTTHSCNCPTGYGGDGCPGRIFFFFFSSLI